MPAGGTQFRKSRVTFYAVTDLTRAQAFYEETLGLKVGPVYGDEDKAWVEYDLAGGGCLAISNMTPASPVCDMSIVTDPDGNQLILHQLKKK